MNNSEVAHAWAHKTYPEAEGSNLFFEGGIIYSYGYHFPIARLVYPPQQAKPTALFTSRSYSLTTTRHKTLAAAAIPYSFKAVTVPDVLAETKAGHKENYAYLKEMVSEASLTLAGARFGGFKEKYLDTLIFAINQANFYTKTFKLGYRQIPPPVPEDVVKKYSKQIKAERLREQHKRSKMLKARRAEAAKWVKYERNTLSYMAPHYLRLNEGDPETVETSNGACVGRKHIIKAWPLIQKVLTQERAFKPNGRTIHLGHYSVDAISKDGTITVGCHKFEKSEVIRFAKTLGLEKTP